MVKKVGKYELGRTLGEGRFGKVKFAVNVETGEAVAIKLMGKEVIVKLNSVERVKREIAIMKAIHHKHVVNLIEVLSSPERIYIVMELLSGGELFHKLATMRRFSESVTRRYFRQLISGLSYCHSKKVFHRDLKPENLLLDDDDNLKISDFGLSALLTSHSSLCHTLCGTPNYVAPDVLQETGRGYDPASADVWSCGVILYVFLAGKLPFDEPTNEALYGKILSANFQIPTYFSPGARNLVKRILDPSPITRYTLEKIQKDPWFNADNKEGVLPLNKQESVGEMEGGGGEGGGGGGEGGGGGGKEEMEIREFNSLSFIQPTEEEPDDQELSMAGTTITNAFELIAVSGALDLTRLLKGKRFARRAHTQFCSNVGRMEVYRRVKDALSSFNLQVQIFDQKFFVSGFNRHGLLRYNVAIMHISTGWHLISFMRDRGNILEYNEFFRNVILKCEDIIWERDPVKATLREWASRASVTPQPSPIKRPITTITTASTTSTTSTASTPTTTTTTTTTTTNNNNNNNNNSNKSNSVINLNQHLTITNKNNNNNNNNSNKITNPKRGVSKSMQVVGPGGGGFTNEGEVVDLSPPKDGPVKKLALKKKPLPKEKTKKDISRSFEQFLFPSSSSSSALPSSPPPPSPFSSSPSSPSLRMSGAGGKSEERKREDF